MATQANTGLARRRVNVRRGIIAVLVVVCMVLFTGYFRESDEGPLHGLQDTAGGVLAPVQKVAVAAIEPLRDAWGWATDLRDARDRAEQLAEENEALRAALVSSRLEDAQRAQTPIAAIGQPLPPELRQYRPVTGRVIARSPLNWYRSARLDVGTSDGVVVNSPVVVSRRQGAALVGLVTSATANSADVSFLTDGRSAVGATIPEANSPPGLLESSTPGQLRLARVPVSFPVREGQLVITAGFDSLGLPSIYPMGLVVGPVTSVGRQEQEVSQAIQVTPFVDPRSLSEMVVLTPDGPKAWERVRGG